MGEKRCQGDATRWHVLAALEGQVGQRWYLWGTRSPSVGFFHSAPRRGAAVPQDHVAKLHPDLGQVGLVGDRSSAYQSLAKHHEGIVWASCWAHVRRDCLHAARSWPESAPWMWQWIEAIRPLSRLKTARLAVWEAPVPLDAPALAFVARQHDLCTHLGERQNRGARYRQERHLHEAKRPILASLHHHGDGLTVLLTRPAVALEKNSAERALRPPVVGRKH